MKFRRRPGFVVPTSRLQNRRSNRSEMLNYQVLEPRQLLATIVANSTLPGVKNWTATTTWVGLVVPGANDRAIIPQNTTVTLNGTSHAVKELVVQGTLTVTETSGVNRSLTSNWIHVNSGGVFQVGTAADRYDTAEFSVLLTGTNPGQTFIVETAMGNMTITDNDSFLMATGGGRLQFFGQDKIAFTKLAATANVGTNQILVERQIDRDFDGDLDSEDGTLNWQVGDQIVIASSSANYADEEVRTITAISNQANNRALLTLSSALSRRHYGVIETYSNATRTWDLDLRAEVALLSRNVRVEGLAVHDTDINFGDRARFTQTLGNVGDGFGGHIMIMGTAGQITVDGVQLDKMGQTARLGRYPIHWHVAGDRTGDVLRRTSITNSNNRGVTIHSTHNVLLQDVVLHDIHGHGFFMEDGVETGNRYIANIAFGIHQVGRTVPTSGSPVPNPNDPFVVDTHDHVGQNPSRFLSSAAYWVTNPDNTWVGNISAGSQGTGFWFIFPGTAIGLSALDPQYSNVKPDRTNLRKFDFNSSHSSPAGLNFDRGSDLEVPVGGVLKEDFDGDNWLPTAEPQINNFTAYKHNVAIYHRGFIANFHEARIADSNIGTFITFTQRVTNTLYVGHSRGNADLTDYVTGHTIYDGANTLDGTHFAGFAASNAHTFRVNGSALRHTSHVMSNTSFENDGSGGHVSISAQGGNAAQTSPFDLSPASIYDVDGTLTGHVGGGPGRTVVTNHPFFYDSNDIRPAGWNAAVSDDLYAMLRFQPDNSNSLYRVTSPDGDQITDEGNTRRNTHVKAGNGLNAADDYRIELVAGSLTDAFVFKYWTRTGPSGSTVLRFMGVGNTLRPQNMNRATTLAQLRAATQTTFTVVNGDVYIKAFNSSNDIRMSSFSSTNPIAINDQATTNAGNGVNINVLSNDRDNDGDSLTVSPGSTVVVTDYIDNFQTGTPAAGWQYLWNDKGVFGNANNYSVMPASGNSYRPASQQYLNLASGSGHPGPGISDGVSFDLMPIAAYTVASSGDYSIANSLLARGGQFGDGVGVLLHVGNTVRQIGSIAPQSSGNFNTSLGFLSAGTTIYVGVSPDGPGAGSSAGNDYFTWDYSITRQAVSSNGQVAVNPDQTVTYTPNPGFVGIDTFSYQISDGRGGSATANVTVTVNPTQAPTVTSVRINEGGVLVRPDLWSTLAVTFNSNVNVNANSLGLVNDTLGGFPVTVPLSGFGYNNITFTATWNFNAAQPLAAAYYRLILDSSLISGIAGGIALDGDNNGTAGGNYSQSHYVAIPGDANLDGFVSASIPSGFGNNGDLFRVRPLVGTLTGAAWAMGDFNGDGDVDGSQPAGFGNVGDLFVLLKNLGSDVRPTAPNGLTSSPVSQAIAPIEDVRDLPVEAPEIANSEIIEPTIPVVPSPPPMADDDPPVAAFEIEKEVETGIINMHEAGEEPTVVNQPKPVSIEVAISAQPHVVQQLSNREIFELTNSAPPSIASATAGDQSVATDENEEPMLASPFVLHQSDDQPSIAPQHPPLTTALPILVQLEETLTGKPASDSGMSDIRERSRRHFENAGRVKPTQVLNSNSADRLSSILLPRISKRVTSELTGKKEPSRLHPVNPLDEAFANLE